MRVRGPKAETLRPVTRGPDVRASNLQVVLELVERQGPISRAELARRAGLSLPSILDIVGDLLDTGLVVWSGEGKSTGGRRPRLLRFNPARGAVLAADLSSSRAVLGLFLLDGTALAETHFALPAQVRGPEVVDRLAAAAADLLARGGSSRPPLLAVGVAAPGVTDPETGEVSLAPAVGWAGTPVRHELEQRLAVPVVVDNDVNAAALAEWRFGEGARYASFAFVSIGTGVGAGLFLNGRIHRGFGNHAGEIGYMAVDSGAGGEAAGGGTFGNLESGNLEWRLSLPALAREYARHSDPGSGDLEAILDELFAEASAGRPEAESLVQERAELLARALLNLYVVLAPEALFLGGPIHPYLPALLPRVEAALEKLSPFRPRLVPSSLQRPGLSGACALAGDLAKATLLASERSAGRGFLP